MTHDILIQRLKERMHAKGINASSLTRQVGVGATFLTDLFRGRKKSLNPNALAQIAQVLETDVLYLTGHQDVPVLRRGDSDLISGGGLLISGAVKIGGFIDFNIEPGALGVAPPPLLPGDWTVVQVFEKAYHPVFRDGDLLYYQKRKLLPEHGIGRECVVQVGQAMYVRVVWKTEAGLWNLTSPTGEPFMNINLEWVYKIEWVRK